MFFEAATAVEPAFRVTLNGAPKEALAALADRPSSPASPLQASAFPKNRVDLIFNLAYSDQPWELVKAIVEYRHLRRALRRWAERFHLCNDGIFDIAISWVCQIHWSETLVRRFPHVDTTNMLRLIPWLPQSETKEDARARLYRMVDQHLAHVEERTEREGFTRVPERRSMAHFHWVAGYQICGWSKNRIAGATGIDRTAVSRAIDRLAKEIGLNPRPATAIDRTWTADRIRAALLSVA
jgi:hypothetical protein